MPAPTRPVTIYISDTFEQWRTQINNASAVINYFVNSSGFLQADNATLTNVNISGGSNNIVNADIRDVTISGATTASGIVLNSSTVNTSTLNNGDVESSNVNASILTNCVIGATNTFNTASFNLPSDDDWRIVGNAGEPSYESAFAAESGAQTNFITLLDQVTISLRVDASSATGVTIFTLPTAYRPTIDLYFNAWDNVGGSIVNCVVLTDGRVQIVTSTSTTELRGTISYPAT